MVPILTFDPAEHLILGGKVLWTHSNGRPQMLTAGYRRSRGPYYSRPKKFELAVNKREKEEQMRFLQEILQASVVSSFSFF